MKQETIEYLRNFKALMDEGIITPEEYEAKKNDLLLKDDQAQSQESTAFAEPIGQPIYPAGVQSVPSKTSSETIDIAWIIVGLIFSLIGVLGFIMNAPKGTFGTDYMTYSYEIANHTVQAIYVVVLAIGSSEICLGLKGYLEKKNDHDSNTATTKA